MYELKKLAKNIEQKKKKVSIENLLDCIETSTLFTTNGQENIIMSSKSQ